MSNKKTMELPEEERLRQFQYMKKVEVLLKDRYNHPPLALVHSYGCQANTADGERIQGMLFQMGYGFTNNANEADFLLYNTCAVRKGAEDRVFGNVGELQHNKQRRPAMIIALCGCMMQQEQVAAKIKKSYPQVDLVFGTHALHRFPQMLFEALTQKRRVFHRDDTEENIVAEGLPIYRDGTFKAWVPIMYGCDNFCTYCIVPYVRGPEHSRRPQQILTEIQGLVAKGYREITLLGQNVNSYGKGLDEETSFAALLCQINDIPGDFRVRFMTSHPKDCTHALLDTIASCKKVCNHIHLPVQSGSNRVLQQMNRHYTQESYLELIRYARKKIPAVTFTSDMIVGFPGETYEDFQQTLQLVQEVNYDALFTFLFSPREGTQAALLDDPVPPEEKLRWFQELLALQHTISGVHNQKLVGQTLRVLAEEKGKTEGTLTGRTEGNAIVDFLAEEQQIGSFLNVRITKSLGWALIGEAVK